MKNLFKSKIKWQHRSNDPASSQGQGQGLPQQTPPSPSPASSPSGGPPALSDYMLSEEEFQMQLAMALSASNSECVGDLDGEQIRKAKLISLGRGDRFAAVRDDEHTADALSRRYRDYNFLDYHEKVIDGFYDIFGPSMESSKQGKMPSLADLQTGIGDLGFEVIVINRAIDTTLQEMEQVAQCILLDFPVANIAVLVQRIAELVTDHMGGPVKDANDMLTRWLEKSTELRTSLHTSLLPIGCIKIVSHGQSDDPSTSAGMSAQQKVILPGGEHPRNENINARNENIKLVSDLQGNSESINLFADLNPFGGREPKRTSVPLNGPDNRNNELQRRRENVVPSTRRPQQRLVMKNWSPYNDVSNNKQYNYVEDSFARRNIGDNAASSSQVPRPSAKNTNLNVGVRTDTPYMAAHNYDNSMAGSSAMKMTSTAGIGKVPDKVLYGDLDKGLTNSRLGDQPPMERHKWGNSVEGRIPTGTVQNQAKEHKENFDGKQDNKKLHPDPKKSPLDRFMDTSMPSRNPESVSPSFARSYKLDTMFDDVSECEIHWEDLVIGERIGLGSYGEVYRADWNGTEVAVKKFLDQDFYGDALDEFRSEVRIMRRLRHPNIVLFMGAVTRPPNLSIVSEYLPRGSLYKILHRPNCQIDEKRRIKMALDVAKGMNCLHISVPTIVHRDLKSPNLLVDNNWNVKVCDFGLSRLKHSTFLSSKSTAGTPEWMAPEVLRNEQSNEKCDVYSFGVILWELATLRMPWSGMNPMQVVGAVGFQDKRLDIPKEIDPLVARIIWECWQKDPNLRPSFAQLTSALKTVQRLVTPSHQESQSPPVPQEIWVNSSTP
uniref:non-specific serine/threonine protein kinase n=1 Tax=Oryza meridionalis TaxID=40149 RepID=A0A0E0CVH2_9ORYZ